MTVRKGAFAYRRRFAGAFAGGAVLRTRAIEREDHYLDLRERQGLSAAQIAERCGCTPWAAQAVIDRGRRRRRLEATAL